ncbi:MAG: molybdopterin-guanine dinucleotide biosynthesis protein B [Anaerovoracaceae bacterium]|jgi:molybdopterin-guanine dinucleotide biosynthesis protein B
MKIINVQGTSKTGKTTTVSGIIKELGRRGYTVGSIKEIHFEGFTLETPGTNTDTHKKSGADQVTARGLTETDVMFNGRMDIERLLDMYDQDYVVIEGSTEANCPAIVTGITTQDLDKQISPVTIAVSGVISNELTEYKGLPVINGVTDIEALVSLIEEKTPERMPAYPEDCCTQCGYGCRGLLEKIISGEAEGSVCIAKGGKIQVFIGEEELPMVPFVQSIVQRVTTSVLGELDGYREDREITIKIRP